MSEYSVNRFFLYFGDYIEMVRRGIYYLQEPITTLYIIFARLVHPRSVQ